MSDRDRISEIKARLDAATPGPWRTRRASWESYNKVWYHPEHWGIAAGEESWHDNEGHFHPDDARYARDEIEVVEISHDRDYQTAEGAITRESDAEFVAAAPDDIAYLLAELERLSAPVEPPVLSRAAIDEMIAKIWPGPPKRSTQPNLRRMHDGAQVLADAILESLSQEEGWTR